jgi:hypothetical protein
MCLLLAAAVHAYGRASRVVVVAGYCIKQTKQFRQAVTPLLLATAVMAAIVLA